MHTFGKAFSKTGHIMLLLSIVLLAASCVDKVDVSACVTAEPYGFWYGLLHGIVAPIDLIVMLFRDDVEVYAQNNNGAWYAFGFILGSGGWGILGGRGSRGRKG